MANFSGAIESYNPYVQQIPTEAYVKVGMFKEQAYNAGVQQIQQGVIDKIGGLEMGNEGDKNYLNSRVKELVSKLNSYSNIDFSDPNNVTQLTALARPLYEDKNILTGVASAASYKKWLTSATEKLNAKEPGMEISTFAYESMQASEWLNSKEAGTPYTGPTIPNTSTEKDLLERIVEYKKDAIENSKFVRNTGFDINAPYFNKETRQGVSEEEFNNFVLNNVMSSADKDMLRNKHWYENSKATNKELKNEVVAQYQTQLEEIEKNIKKYEAYATLASGDEKEEYQEKIEMLTKAKKSLYDETTKKGYITDIKSLKEDDKGMRDVFHRILGESRFLSSLGVLTEETVENELVFNQGWKTLSDAVAAAAAAADKPPKSPISPTDPTKVKTPQEVLEVGDINPTDATNKTDLTKDRVKAMNDEFNTTINSTVDQMYAYLKSHGFDNIDGYFEKDKNNNIVLEMERVGMNTVYKKKFKPGQKEQFYKLIHGLDYIYNQEAQTANRDKKFFTNYVAKYHPEYDDSKPESFIDLKNEDVERSLKELRGGVAMLPKIEALFSDKDFLTLMGTLDKTLKEKQDFTGVFRSILITTQKFTQDEIASIKKMSPEELFSAGTGNAGKGTYTLGPSEKDSKTQVIKLYDKEGEFLREGVVPTDKLEDFKKQAEKLQYSYAKDKPSRALKSSHIDEAFKVIEKNFAYVQENFNFSLGNLKKNEAEYQNLKDMLTSSLIQTKVFEKGNSADFKIVGGNITDLSKLSGFKVTDIISGSLHNTDNILKPNPVVTAQVTGHDSDGKPIPFDIQISLASMIASTPHYKKTAWGEYFAPLLYAKEAAFSRMKAQADPLNGKLTYRPPLKGEDKNPHLKTNHEPMIQYPGDGYWYDDAGEGSLGISWITTPMTRGGKTTLISYQVVGYGGSASEATSEKDPSGKPLTRFENEKFYIKFKMPGSKGKPVIGYFKALDGSTKGWNSAALAHYFMNEYVINNPSVDIDEVDPKTKEVNYFTTNPLTVRGIFNTQFSLNGQGVLTSKIVKDHLGGEQEFKEARGFEVRF